MPQQMPNGNQKNVIGTATQKPVKQAVKKPVQKNSMSIPQNSMNSQEMPNTQPQMNPSMQSSNQGNSEMNSQTPDMQDKKNIFSKWWFWTILAVGLLVLVVGIFLII